MTGTEEKKPPAPPSDNQSASNGINRVSARAFSTVIALLFPPAPRPLNPEVEAAWAARMIRAGALLAIFADLLYITGAWAATVTPWPITAIHTAEIAIALVALGFTFTSSFPRIWRVVVFVLASILAAGNVATGVISTATTPTLVAIMLLSTGSGALIPWEPVWQVGFDAVCLVAWACTWMMVPSQDDYAVYRWSGVIIACGLAHFASIMRTRYACARDEAERMLADSEHKLRQVLEASLDTITINRVRDGCFISVSPSSGALGYTPEELIGVAGLKEGIWASLVEHEEFVRDLRHRGQVRNLEVTFRRKDNSLVPCLVSAKITELDGEPCVVTVSRDITKLKQTELALVEAREKALKASQAKSEFVASLAHEIRTPMNAVLGMADLLMETRLSPEQRRYVRTMISNGATLLDLMNDVLDMSQIESGRIAIEETGFNLDDLIDQVAEAQGVRAHEKGLEMATRIMGNVPLNLVGDPLRLRQILVNLVSNAIKFTNHGHVMLTVEREPGAGEQGLLRFSLEDTGIGIAKEKIENIFGRFSQAESWIARKYGGSGLGLNIVRRLVDLMGGKVWVESELGKGSVFRFTAQFKVDSAREAARAIGQPDLNGIKALVVDDTKVNRLILSEMLLSRGASVTEVCNGPDAIAEVERSHREKSPYRIILLDYRMPGMDGIEVAERLRGMLAKSETEILMLTSDGMGAQLQRMRAAGLSLYIVKPIRRSELFGAIGRLLQVPEPEKPSASSASRNTPPVSLRPLHILLAEDSPDNRLLIAAFLKKTAYTLDEVENGEQALERFKSGSYDAVLMDMQMPVMDGYTAVRKMRQWEHENGLARTPIVALTGAALNEAVLKTTEAGCDLHLIKPFKRASLLATIENITQAARESAGFAAAAGS